MLQPLDGSPHSTTPASCPCPLREVTFHAISVASVRNARPNPVHSRVVGARHKALAGCPVAFRLLCDNQIVPVHLLRTLAYALQNVSTTSAFTRA